MHPEIDLLTRAPYFDTYLKLLDSSAIEKELTDSALALEQLLYSLNEDQLSQAYAEGKWTIKEVVQHVIETEMIFNYRAMRIGREDEAQNLPGFDENAFVDASVVTSLTRADLLDYFASVRRSTIYLSKTFSDEQMNKIGVASGHEVQVKALFLIQSGHTLHHMNVIKERYLN